MPWTFISDVHIKSPGDESEKLLIDFIDQSLELKASKVFLVGDIFDLMVGGKAEYLDKFQNVFDQLSRLKDTEIHFFEGNHDFHIQQVWELFIKKYSLEGNCIYHSSGAVFDFQNSKVWVSHGDDIEIGNFSYKAYKTFIRSFGIKFLANYIVPYSLITKIGESMSKASRDHNRDRYHSPDSQEDIKTKFRLSASRVFESTSAKIIVAGHSHVQDLFETEDFCYLNNGYVPITKSYSILEESGKIRFGSISQDRP